MLVVIPMLHFENMVHFGQDGRFFMNLILLLKMVVFFIKILPPVNRVVPLLPVKIVVSP